MHRSSFVIPCLRLIHHTVSVNWCCTKSWLGESFAERRGGGGRRAGCVIFMMAVYSRWIRLEDEKEAMLEKRETTEGTCRRWMTHLRRRRMYWEQQEYSNNGGGYCWMVTACDEVFRWRCGNSGRRIAKEQQQMGTIRNVGSHLNTFQFIFLHEISWLVDVYCECVVTFGLCCSSWQQRRGKERIYPVAKGRQLTGTYIYNNILSDMRESRWCTNCEIGKARWNKG